MVTLCCSDENTSTKAAYRGKHYWGLQSRTLEVHQSRKTRRGYRHGGWSRKLRNHIFNTKQRVIWNLGTTMNSQSPPPMHMSGRTALARLPQIAPPAGNHRLLPKFIWNISHPNSRAVKGLLCKQENMSLSSGPLQKNPGVGNILLEPLHRGNGRKEASSSLASQPMQDNEHQVQ